MTRRRPNRPARLGLALLIGALLALAASPANAGRPADEYFFMDAWMRGNELSAEEAEALEKKLEENPEDLSTRATLLGYYERKQFDSPSFRENLGKHVVWIIENKPESSLNEHAKLHHMMNEQHYKSAKNLWEKHVENNPENTTILWNASEFFKFNEFELSEKYLMKGRELEPDSPDWPSKLASLYEFKIRTINAEAEMAKKMPLMVFKNPQKIEDVGKNIEFLQEAENKIAEAKIEAASKRLAMAEEAIAKDFMAEPSNLATLLDNAAQAAFDAGKPEVAASYANKILKDVKLYRGNWNYGNSIHDGHMILGRVALLNGDVEKAKEHLIAAGNTPGSPQLNSFGPSFKLAKELLAKGERDAVVEYLKLCKRFWNMHADKLDEWIGLIEEGGEPGERDYKWHMR